MNAVEATKAGVASGILSMSRMVGGTFGVAALGALVSGHRPARPRRARSPRCRPGPASGSPSRSARRRLRASRPMSPAAAQEAFVHALQVGLRVGAAVAFVGAIAAAVLIEARPAPVPAASDPRARRARASRAGGGRGLTDSAPCRSSSASTATRSGRLRGRGEFFWLDLLEPTRRRHRRAGGDLLPAPGGRRGPARISASAPRSTTTATSSTSSSSGSRPASPSRSTSSSPGTRSSRSATTSAASCSGRATGSPIWTPSARTTRSTACSTR